MLWLGLKGITKISRLQHLELVESDKMGMGSSRIVLVKGSIFDL